MQSNSTSEAEVPRSGPLVANSLIALALATSLSESAVIGLSQIATLFGHLTVYGHYRRELPAAGGDCQSTTSAWPPCRDSLTKSLRNVDSDHAQRLLKLRIEEGLPVQKAVHICAINAANHAREKIALWVTKAVGRSRATFLGGSTTDGI